MPPSRSHLILRGSGALAALAGLLLALWLVASHDAGDVLAAAAEVGWGILAIVLVRALIIAVTGMAWGVTVRPFVSVEFRRFVFLRWIRESINNLLPVATVGGDLIGGRLLALSGVAGGLAGASILVDLLLQAVAQVQFTLLGLLALLSDGKDRGFAPWILSALGLVCLGLGGFYITQRIGLFGRFAHWARLQVSHWAPFSGEGEFRLNESLHGIYAHRKAVWRSGCLHVLAWFIGVAEVWIGLAAMGYQPRLMEALVLESLSLAMRGAAFPVPGGLGVQEGGFLLFGSLYGLDPHASLALALVKRVPELILGIPGLLVWHAIAVRHWLGSSGVTDLSEDPYRTPAEFRRKQVRKQI